MHRIYITNSLTPGHHSSEMTSLGARAYLEREAKSHSMGFGWAGKVTGDAKRARITQPGGRVIRAIVAPGPYPRPASRTVPKWARDLAKRRDAGRARDRGTRWERISAGSYRRPVGTGTQVAYVWARRGVWVLAIPGRKISEHKTLAAAKRATTDWMREIGMSRRRRAR